MFKKHLKTYQPILILLGSIFLGSVIGLQVGENAKILQPIGDMFLNLLFVCVVPLVFFSIASAIAQLESENRLSKIISVMLIVFIVTGAIASLLMLGVVSFFPLGEGVDPSKFPQNTELVAAKTWQEMLVSMFTVSDFSHLLSRKNMLPLIVFAVLVGLATRRGGTSTEGMKKFLLTANNTFLELINLIMYLAPVGLGAYFAYLTGVFGPTLMGVLFKSVGIYYLVTIFYFFVFFSIYAWLADQKNGVRAFWQNIVTPSLVSLGTCSSMATIPSNIQAADDLGVPKDISRLVIPIGATIHMDGSCISAITKIAVLSTIFGYSLNTPYDWAIAVGVSILSGMVMSGIPGGGTIGEILLVTLYGFPPIALPIATAIGQLVDPIATVVNACGDNVCCMLIARVTEGKKWRQAQELNA
jgi:Na+/H+-dicarboxylate symporter